MLDEKYVLLDGNEAAAHVAYKVSEVCAIYPITPSSSMGEWTDTWSAQGKENIWGTIPNVIEMQSEAGAAGAVHGALQAGSMTTTFTASQGLLLMIPNMYKIAGELTPAVFHVAARSIASSALSIFGEHSDVMAARQTGFAMLCSNSVQESMDMSLIAHSSTLKAKVPFIHFFDGFRTSHEISKVREVTDETIKKMIDIDDVIDFRDRALTPDKPVIRGTAQNPDVFFQSREASNIYYDNAPEIVEGMMDKFFELTGRRYQLFDYYGADNADRVIVVMGSASEAISETVDYLLEKGESVGVLKVRLYRPFSMKHFLKAIPKTVKSISVLDRTKEPGSTGEPLYLDVVSTISESFQNGSLHLGHFPKIVGGRYGLSSKEFTPAMIKAIFEELKSEKPKNHFTIGIKDDVTFTSLEYDENFSIESDNVFRGIFWGLGSDGTVSANKNSIKIIGSETENFAQGYFVYDSKKSGSTTTSYLRFGKDPIRSSYLIKEANFIACHQFQFLEKIDVLENINTNGTFLLNAPHSKNEIWSYLPKVLQEKIVEKNVKFYVIDAAEVAKNTGMGRRVNTIMQTAFFAISGILPQDEAIEKIKKSIKKTFSKKGDRVVEQNFAAVDKTIENLFLVDTSDRSTNGNKLSEIVSKNAPDFVKDVSSIIMSGKGDSLPVSKLPCDGTFPTGTTKWEKRNIAHDIPIWDPNTCIQCGKCSVICPHGVIRIKAYDECELKSAPEDFQFTKARGKDFEEATKYTIQVSPEDCTGCELCVEICPAKNKSNTSLKAINMNPLKDIKDREVKNWEFFSNIEDYDRDKIKQGTIKGSQLLRPLFEFSGACAGCGETPYIKLVTQLFGDRMLIANATGCSSIYGGNLPTTPYTKNKEGRGPAWANSLFEDNAEFGLGFRLSVDKKQEHARELIYKHRDELDGDLVDSILKAKQKDESDIFSQRDRVEKLRETIINSTIENKNYTLGLIDYLVKKSVWIFGGDGWAYDIGYGGLDHVLASGKNVNILVLDTEVYSNTGGQMSKSTPIGAVAKFAANGRSLGKKDLGLLAMGYGHVYVGKIALGANDTHTLKTLIEAEKYDGPSLIIAYSPCIAHGYNMKYMASQQKLAVETGHWHLYRYNPDRVIENQNPFVMDSKIPKKALAEYMGQEMRFNILRKMDPERAKTLGEIAQNQADSKYEYLQELSKMSFSKQDQEELS